MKNKLSAMLLSAAGGAAMLFATSEAKASYVCYTTYDPKPTTFNKFTGETFNYGSYGQVEVTLYSLPNCKGTYVGYYSFCSTGASSNTVAYCDTAHAWSSTQILSLFESLQRAAAAKQSIYIYKDTNGISPYAGLDVTFYSAE
jgi:hypothetical protein